MNIYTVTDSTDNSFIGAEFTVDYDNKRITFLTNVPKKRKSIEYDSVIAKHDDIRLINSNFSIHGRVKRT